MFASHAGNLILTTAEGPNSTTSLVAVAPQIASSATSGSIKAVTAQFFGPSNATTTSTAVSTTATTTATGGLTTANVSVFDAPAYVSAANPTAVNNANTATFFVGGYSAFEKNDAIYDAMEDMDAEDEEEDNADNSDDENGASKKKSKKSSLNKHLMVPMVKGHRAAILSACQQFVYVVRTDTFALDWAVEVSSIVSASTGASSSSASAASVKQLVLLDAHRVLILLGNGKLFFATRPLSSAEGTVFGANANLPAKVNDANIGRKPSSDKFRYFVTTTVVAVTGAPAKAGSEIISLLPTTATHSAKAKTLTVGLVAIVAGASATTSFAINTASIVITLEGAAKATINVTADEKKKAFTTVAKPTSFILSPTTAVDAEGGSKATGKKKGAAATPAISMILAAVGTTFAAAEEKAAAGKKGSSAAAAAAAAEVTVAHLVALDETNATVASLTAVKTAEVGSAAISTITTTAAELLTDNMIAVGIAATTANSGVVGKVVYGTFYYENETNRAEGANISTTVMNLTEDASTASSSSSTVAAGATLIPAGFYYNARLTQQAIVAVNTTAAAAATAIASIRLCGVSLLNGLPTNGATISSFSWVTVNSVITGNASTAATYTEDKITAGKAAGANAKNFVTLNYPIVTLGAVPPSEADDDNSSAAFLASDPYRICDSRVYGRVSITAPVAVHGRALAQWPNAVIGVLKLLVDYTSYSIGQMSASAGSTTTGINANVLNVLKRIAEATARLMKHNTAGGFEVTIVTHAFHPSAIRNALRRLPFAVAAAVPALVTPAAAVVEAAKKAPKKGSKKSAEIGVSVSVNELVNGLFASLLDGVDASASAEKLNASASADKKKATTKNAVADAADSFLRSAVGALEICHHIITLQGQLGAQLQQGLVSRYVLLLRSLRTLGDGCDQIVGRLTATLDRQRIAATHAAALEDEKARIRQYQLEKQGGNVEAAEDASSATAKKSATAAQPKVSFAKADIRHKIAAVGTGNVADGLSAQLSNHKSVLDLVDQKLAAKLNNKKGAATAENNNSLPLYASAGMRHLKSDFQDHYERYLLLGGTK